MKTTKKKPSNFVLLARKKLNLSQTELAALLGKKSYRTVLNYEKGYIPVPPLVISELKRLLEKNGIDMMEER